MVTAVAATPATPAATAVATAAASPCKLLHKQRLLMHMLLPVAIQGTTGGATHVMMLYEPVAAWFHSRIPVEAATRYCPRVGHNVRLIHVLMKLRTAVVSWIYMLLVAQQGPEPCVLLPLSRSTAPRTAVAIAKLQSCNC